MDLSIVIPLFNEEESLKELSDWIFRIARQSGLSCEIVFIDDGSIDKSWNVITNLSKENKDIKAIKFRRNYGKSAALFHGFHKATGDVIITMDADLQDSPEEIPSLYKMINDEGLDLVSGWKRKRYDSFLFKNIPSKIYNYTAKIFTGINLHDMNCGLKAYRREVIKCIEVYGEMHRYIPVLAKQAGFTKIGEKEVMHQKRKYGATKFGLERFIYGFLDLLSIIFISKFGKRPMHLFGTFGTLMFLIGGFITAWLTGTKVYCIHHNLPVREIVDQPLFYLAILMIILGVQLFLAGFLGELISRNSSERNKYFIDKEIG